MRKNKFTFPDYNNLQDQTFVRQHMVIEKHLRREKLLVSSPDASGTDEEIEQGKDICPCTSDGAGCGTETIQEKPDTTRQAAPLEIR